MIIKNIKFKNIKSYGAKYQNLSFSKEGSLLLLSGDNGTGKSTIENVISYSVYSKVRGKKSKFLPKKDIPNRLNKNMEVYLECETNDKQSLSIFKGLEPKKELITLDTVDITNEYNKNLENFVNINYDLYNMLISLNMSDFKDFISLNKEDKEKLINKMFNLSDLNILHSYTNELYNELYEKISIINEKLDSVKAQIQKHEIIVDKIENEQNQSLLKENKEATDSINEKKPVFLKLQTEIEDIKERNNILVSEIKNIYIQKNDTELTIRKCELKLENYNTKLNSYTSGKCPVCESELLKDEHKEDIELLTKYIKENIDQVSELKEYTDNLLIKEFEIKNKLQSNKTDYKYKSEDFSLIKEEVSELKNKINSNKKHLIKKELSLVNDELLKLYVIKIDLEYNLNNLNIKLEAQKKLLQIFRGDKIRNDVIHSILKPLNENMKFFLDQMNCSYEVEIDNKFNAIIKDRDIINPETLSKGEDKKINISIFLSYLKMMLKTKHMNLLFLDEMFDGLEKSSIPIIIKNLKKLSTDYKINIIIINHMNQNLDLFDQIIHFNKDIFSDIEIQELKT